MAKEKKATKKFKRKHLKAEVQKRKRFKHAKARRSAAEAISTTADAAKGEADDSDAEPVADVDGFVDTPAQAFDQSESSDDGGVMDELDELMGEDTMDQQEGQQDSAADDDDVSDDEYDDEGADVSGEAEAGSDVAHQNVKLRGAIASHRAQLEALKQQDPEFYEYLRSTDSQLLDFGEGEEEEEEGEEEEGEHNQDDEDTEQEAQPEPQEEKQQNKQKVASRVLTSATVERWCEAAKKDGTMGAMQYLLQAYRVACHYGDTDDSFDASIKITSSSVYNKIMLFVLKEADGIFRRMLGVADKDKLSGKEISGCSRWKKVEPMVKSYLGNTVHLLGQLTDSRMLSFILRRLRESMSFLGLQQRVLKKLLKISINLFGSADSAARVQSILLLRQACVNLPSQALDVCLKGVYRSYSSNAKFVTAASMPHINFMAVCLTELYGLDVQASYQHAFEFIRQLAVLLRGALTMKTSDSYRQVYCWQTINCLELWAKVLSAHADKQELRPLVYPLTQILLGAARLVPSPLYFPLRLRLLRSLNRLSASTCVFIPVGPLLLEMMTWTQLYKNAKGGSGSCPDLLLQLRLSKSNLSTSSVQEEIITQVMELLCEHMAQWSYSIAFPEMSHIIATHLKRFTKNCPVDRFRKMCKQLVDAIERNAAWVATKRSSVDFSPKDTAQVRDFLSQEKAKQQSPLSQYRRMMTRNAAQRRAAQTSNKVTIGRENGASVALDEEGGEEEEEFEGQLLPKKEVGKKGDKKTQKTTAAKETGKRKPVEEENDESDDQDINDHTDIVQDYIMSEEEEEHDGNDDSDDDDNDDEDDDNEDNNNRTKQVHKGGGPTAPFSANTKKNKHPHNASKSKNISKNNHFKKARRKV